MCNRGSNWLKTYWLLKFDGIQPKSGFPSAKKDLFMLFVFILDPFWCSVVTSVIFSSDLGNFRNNPKKSQ